MNASSLEMLFLEYSYRVVLGEADSLPPLHGDGYDQKNTGRQGEVTATLEEWENQGDETVVEAKVKRKNNHIGEEEDYFSNTETGEKPVKQIELLSETKDLTGKSVMRVE